MKQLKTDPSISYADVKKLAIELARRANLINAMTVKLVSQNGSPKFNFSDREAALDLPDLTGVNERLAELEAQIGETSDTLDQCTSAKQTLQEEVDDLQSQLDNYVADNGGTFVFSHTRTTGTGVCAGSYTVTVVAYYEGDNKWTIETLDRPSCGCTSYSIEFIRPNGTTAFSGDGHPSPSTGNSATAVGVWTVRGVYNCDGPTQYSTLGSFVVRTVDGSPVTSLSVNEYLNTVEVTY